MPNALTLIEPTPDDHVDRDRLESGDDPKHLIPRPVAEAPIPSLARIASLQHWLDLCA